MTKTSKHVASNQSADHAHLQGNGNSTPCGVEDGENQLDHELTLAFGERAMDNYPTRRQLTLGELIEELEVPETTRGKLSSEEYHALDVNDPAQKKQRNQEKDGKYFTVGSFGDKGQRLAANLTQLCGFALDFDSGKTTRQQIEDRLQRYTYVAYTSYSHRSDHEKWRVFIPYRSPITPQQHKSFYSIFQRIFAGDLDPHCENPGQLWYTPACPHDAADQFQCFHKLGEMLDPSTLDTPPMDDVDLKSASKTKPQPEISHVDPERLEDALQYIKPDDRKIWIEVGMAIKHDLDETGLKIWLKWSSKSAKFDFDEAMSTWESLKPNETGGITVGTVYHRAKGNGWPDDAATEKVPDHIAELNESHFVAFDGAKTLIFRESIDPVFGRRKLDALRQPDFRLGYANKFVMSSGPDGKAKSVCVADVWIKHPKRREYEGVVLAPNKHVHGYYNLWRGFAVQAKSGNWKRMKEHARKILCRGDKEAYEYLISWLAYGIQHPDKQAEVAVVLRGGRGTGKGMFARAFGQMFGQHFVHISQSKHLTGNFNAHLHDCIVLFVDEAFWAGDKQGEAELKRLVTEPTLAIERKGLDVVMVPNMLHILMASNSYWVVPAGTDERRFFVLDVDDSKKQNPAYFSALQKELDAGGLEAMLYDLQKHDLSQFDIRQFPQTAALTEQKLLSLEPHEKWWLQKLNDGKLSPNQDGWEEISKFALHENYVVYVQKTGVSRRSTETELGMKLRNLLPAGYPKSSKKKYTGIGTTAVYGFPPLDVCRKHFEKVLGLERLDWDEGKTY